MAIRSLREFWRRFRTFGNDELDVVKQRLVQLRQDVETLKQARRLRVEMEEKIIVHQLRQATEMFREAEKALDRDLDKAKQLYSQMEEKAMLDAMLKKQERIMANTEHLLRTVDVEKFLRGAPIEECQLEPEKGTSQAPGAIAGSLGTVKGPATLVGETASEATETFREAEKALDSDLDKAKQLSNEMEDDAMFETIKRKQKQLFANRKLFARKGYRGTLTRDALVEEQEELREYVKEQKRLVAHRKCWLHELDVSRFLIGVPIEYCQLQPEKGESQAPAATAGSLDTGKGPPTLGDETASEVGSRPIYRHLEPPDPDFLGTSSFDDGSQQTGPGLSEETRPPAAEAPQGTASRTPSGTASVVWSAEGGNGQNGRSSLGPELLGAAEKLQKQGSVTSQGLEEGRGNLASAVTARSRDDSHLEHGRGFVMVPEGIPSTPADSDDKADGVPMGDRGFVLVSADEREGRRSGAGDSS